MSRDVLKAMYHQSWGVLDWWDLGLAGEDRGSLLVGGDTCFVVRDVTWGSGTSLQTFLRKGSEWSGFQSITLKEMRALLPEDIHVFFTSQQGYDLRIASPKTEIEMRGSEVMVLKAPVLWITGVYPQKGCLYLTSSGTVSPEPEGALWTSYHAYPHSEGVVSTRVRNLKQILLNGEPQIYEDKGDGVYLLQNVKSGPLRFDVETF